MSPLHDCDVTPADPPLRSHQEIQVVLLADKCQQRLAEWAAKEPQDLDQDELTKMGFHLKQLDKWTSALEKHPQ